MKEMFYKFYLPLISLILITFSLGFFYLSRPNVQLAGDIVEYYGITESLKNHFSFNLTNIDQQNLEKVLHPEYFLDPGYYIFGKDNNKYPVHFVFYSILATPIRLILEFTNQNPLLSLTFLNLSLILLILLALIWHERNKNPILLLTIFFSSPLIFFIPWPGPDIFYTLFLLISIYYFLNGKILISAIFATFASWHSQPLAIFSVVFTFYYFLTHKHILDIYNHKKIKLNFLKPFFVSILIAFVLFVPYIFNFFAFGVFTPWTLFDNWWNQLYGFGIQNISIKKLYEQFFDLNVGIFWYSPLLFIFGMYQLIKKTFINPKYLILLNTILISALFYHTNPAWHFGTSGYGPSRHIIFLIPILILLTYEFLQKFPLREKIKISLILIFSQAPILYLNGYFLPNFENTLKHNHISRFVLNNYPHFYNPTPEIFIDRTLSQDFNYLSSSVYKNEKGECKKAYILKHNKDYLLRECGFIPNQYTYFFENDEYLLPKNYIRKVKTYEAKLIPQETVCLKSNNCISDLNEIKKIIPQKEWDRISYLENGVWKISFGRPFELTIPTNYKAEIYHTEGLYINFY